MREAATAISGIGPNYPSCTVSGLEGKPPGKSRLKQYRKTSNRIGERKMKKRNLFVSVIAVAGFLLLGASNARACCIEVFEAWIVLGVDSSSGEFEFGTQPVRCMDGVRFLRKRGFLFREISQVNANVSVLLFLQPGFFRDRDQEADSVSLFCYAIINEFDEDIPG